MRDFEITDLLHAHGVNVLQIRNVNTSKSEKSNTQKYEKSSHRTFEKHQIRRVTVKSPKLAANGFFYLVLRVVIYWMNLFAMTKECHFTEFLYFSK
jgi:hypothetical protein